MAAGSALLSYHFIRQGPLPVTAETTPTAPQVNPSFIEVELGISAGEGHIELNNISVIEVKTVDSLMFRVVDSRAEGLSSIALSGVARLKSENKSYKIDMPCILHFNSSCPRITVIIPGYDVPLTVDPGKYLLTIEFRWKDASNAGKTYLKILPRAYRADIVPLGERAPENTENWIAAKNSTRSYMMLVDKVESAADQSGFGEFMAYVWIFDQSGGEFKKFRFELTARETGEVARILEVTVMRDGPYYRLLLLVKARPGNYSLSLVNPVNLSIDIEVK